jgi:hypothetical protein
MSALQDDLDAPAPSRLAVGLWRRMLGTALQERRAAVTLVSAGIMIAAATVGTWIPSFRIALARGGGG